MNYLRYIAGFLHCAEATFATIYAYMNGLPALGYGLQTFIVGTLIDTNQSDKHSSLQIHKGFPSLRLLLAQAAERKAARR